METTIKLIRIEDYYFGISDEPIKEGDFYYLESVTTKNMILKASESKISSNCKKILFSNNPKDTRFPFLVMPSKEQEVERLALEYTNATRERRALYGTVYSAFKTGFNANKGIYTQEQMEKAINMAFLYAARLGEQAINSVDEIIQSLQPTAKAVRVEMEEILATADEYEEAGTVRIGYEIKLEKSKEHPQGIVKALEVIY